MSRAGLALALLAIAGCTDQTDLLPADGGADACVAPGPPVMLGDSCAGALSAQLLRYALCSCNPLVLDRGLFTEGGSMPGGPSGPPVAAVGTDGSLQVGGPVQVAGTLEAGGAAGAAFARTSVVFGNLRSGGPIGANQLLTVGGDVYAAGDVLGRVDVNGTLHVPDGVSPSVDVTAGSVVHGPVTVAPPCNCAAGPAVDPAALAAAHATANDNVHIGLSADDYAAGAGPSPLDLPCGQYYLSRLVVPKSAEIHVHGRAALFVGGDVQIDDGLRVVVDTGAELDLVIAGNLNVQAGLLGATPAAPLRIWLAGKAAHTGPMAVVSAAVYAPNTSFGSDGDLTFTGAVLAHDLQPVGDVSVRFDRAILNGGASCGAAPQPPVD